MAKLTGSRPFGFSKTLFDTINFDGSDDFNWDAHYPLVDVHLPLCMVHKSKLHTSTSQPNEEDKRAKRPCLIKVNTQPQSITHTIDDNDTPKRE
uniref:Uncharacterized protein n=1 Tax=Glossina palpalis gambiensis TaxID=67801 RepID=A0A1B0ATX6_9MUSC